MYSSVVGVACPRLHAVAMMVDATTSSESEFWEYDNPMGGSHGGL